MRDLIIQLQGEIAIERAIAEWEVESLLEEVKTREEILSTLKSNGRSTKEEDRGSDIIA